ncbi:MAG: acetyl-CoA carboxylase biotin carboxyl carrier protein [Moraxellaceae bacterium]|nr:acetyl-CoA carboxylase biotin carboxyl carrier protein [Moraxellaceae bacterium]
MEIDYIRKLIELMEEKELVTLELSQGKEAVKLTRYYPSEQTVISTPMQAMPMEKQSEVSTAPQPTGKTENSPMVGVFYSAPSPNDPPFVSVGQKVKAGEQLGIIEAMKIMNPLEATQSGIIDEILVKNGEVVEFGQAIIRYKS